MALIVTRLLPERLRFVLMPSACHAREDREADHNVERNATSATMPRITHISHQGLSVDFNGCAGGALWVFRGRVAAESGAHGWRGAAADPF
jgi:hypothetical protein